MNFLSSIFLVTLILTAPQVSLNEVKQTMPFKVLVPQASHANWELVVNTYPKDNEEDHEKVGLHYVDSNKVLIVGIIESDASSIKNDHFDGEKVVDIDGNKGYFAKWVAAKEGTQGGELSWSQGNTNIRLTSFKLSEEEMISLAKSMK